MFLMSQNINRIEQIIVLSVSHGMKKLKCLVCDFQKVKLCLKKGKKVPQSKIARTFRGFVEKYQKKKRGQKRRFGTDASQEKKFLTFCEKIRRCDILKEIQQQHFLLSKSVNLL